DVTVKKTSDGDEEEPKTKKEEPKKEAPKITWKGEDGNFGEKIGYGMEFTNPYWKLKIHLEEENGKREKLNIDIWNLLGRRQRLDIFFLVKLHKTLPPEKIFIAGEPLMPKGSDGESRKVTITLNPGIAREGVFAVEQVLNWETAAVKRIDQIAIGSSD